MADIRNPHFVIPKREDFAEKEFKLSVTQQSIEAFELGRRGQGYIGLVDLTNGHIHLVPSFNKNDGLLRLDKNGNPFKLSAESIAELGSFTGDLHGRCAGILGLGEKVGAEGQIMGFGIWKGGSCLKILSELPNTPALIPGEFLLVKETRRKKTEAEEKKDSVVIPEDHADAGWELYFTREGDEYEDVKIQRLPLNTEIRQILAKVKDSTVLNNFSKRTTDAKEKVLELRSWLEQEVEKIANEDPEARIICILNSKDSWIKYLKHRSSSQNVFSVKYSELYRDVFRLSMRHFLWLKHTKSHLAHVLTLPRELPYKVFFKIMSTIKRALKMDRFPFAHLADGVNGIRMHLEVERNWMYDPREFLKNLFNELTEHKDGLDEIKALIKKHKDIDFESILFENLIDAFNKDDPVRFNFFLRCIDLEKSREKVIYLMENFAVRFAGLTEAEKQELLSPPSVGEEKQVERQLRMEFLALFPFAYVNIHVGLFKPKETDLDALLSKRSLIDVESALARIPVDKAKKSTTESTKESTKESIAEFTNEITKIKREQFLKIVQDYGTTEQREWAAAEIKTQPSNRLRG